MTRGVRWYLVGSVVLVALAALVALVGCSSHWIAEREPWRHEAEVACLNSGAVHEGAEKMRISAINGPGMCGADFPLKVSALGGGSAMGYDDDMRPPGLIPNAGSMPQRWPGSSPPADPYYSPPVDARPLPPVDAQTAPRYGSQPYTPRYYPPGVRAAPPAGPPISLTPPGVADPDNDEPLPQEPPPTYSPARPEFGMPRSYPGQPGYRQPGAAYPPPPARPEPLPSLGPARGPLVTGAVGPVEVQPAATLACPIVSALDQWINTAVQPAAMRWFRQPVVEIKQISAYSCRGMNGNPNAHISEHAFGNALDVAAFILADGRKVTVQYGWKGTPEEQGFLRDVQGAACEQFTTVLAPGANVYHYNHIHVDLMRHASGRHICEPSAVPGDVVAERARSRFALQRGEPRYEPRIEQRGDPGVTGSVKAEDSGAVKTSATTRIKHKWRRRDLEVTGENDGRLPLAIPGED
jgi:hypothetical protein